MVTRLNLPSETATAWLADGTAEKELLEHGIGREIIDATPKGRLELAHKVIQFPIDITRRTSPKRLQELLRGVLAMRPECRRVGVITHSTLTRAAKELGGLFEARILIVTHFGSGQDRGSNQWLRAGCDLIVVAGTPRVDETEIKKLLHRCGDIDALNRDGDWGELNWQGFTTTDKPRVIKGRGYRDPDWLKVHRSKVRASIIQAAGRARALLETGCDAVLLTTEETSFPLAEPGQDVEPLTESEAAVFDALSELVLLIHLENKLLCATSAEVAARCDLTDRHAREMLSRLEQRGMVTRIGERGGWRLADAWLPSGAGAEGGASC